MLSSTSNKWMPTGRYINSLIPVQATHILGVSILLQMPTKEAPVWIGHMFSHSSKDSEQACWLTTLEGVIK